MDYNNNEPMPGNNPVNNNTNNSNYYNGNEQNGMATASLVLGILAVISICCVYGSYILGGIAITLALLSRGKDTKLHTNALIGTILSIIGIVIATILIVLYFITMISTNGFANYMKAYESYYEEMTGEEFPYNYDTFRYNKDSNEFDFNQEESNDSYHYDDNSTPFNYDYDEDSQPQQPDLPNVLTITI